MSSVRHPWQARASQLQNNCSSSSSSTEGPSDSASCQHNSLTATDRWRGGREVTGLNRITAPVKAPQNREVTRATVVQLNSLSLRTVQAPLSSIECFSLEADSYLSRCVTALKHHKCVSVKKEEQETALKWERPVNSVNFHVELQNRKKRRKKKLCEWDRTTGNCHFNLYKWVVHRNQKRFCEDGEKVSRWIGHKKRVNEVQNLECR